MATPPTRSSAGSRARVIRWPAILLLAGAVVAMALVSGDPPEQSSTADARPLVPTAGLPDALSSTWYCAAGTIVAEGPADHEVIVGNPTDRPAQVEITIFPVLAPEPIIIDVENADAVADQVDLSPPESVVLDPVQVGLEVPARTVVRSRLADFEGVGGEHAAALVESDVGNMIVEHVVSGPAGAGVSPCASASASSFSFAAGTTRKGATQIISIFNPFPGDAVVDLTFTTDSGPRSPQIYDGLVVPSGSVLPVDITDVVTLFDSVSADLSVRTGRVVADRLLAVDGSQGPGGLSVAVGSPEPALTWVFASSAPTDSVEAITIHNPSLEEEALVDVDIWLDVPEFNGIVEPVSLTIRPGRSETLVFRPGANLVAATRVNDVSGRILADVGFWTSVRSLNGVAVVADHLSVDEAPTPVAFAASPGATVAATSHMLTTLDGLGEVAVVNPSDDQIAALTIEALVDGQVFSLAPIEVPEQSRLVLDLAALGVPPNALLTIEASAPILAERRVPVNGQGLVTALTIPVAGTTSLPELPLPS